MSLNAYMLMLLRQNPVQFHVVAWTLLMTFAIKQWDITAYWVPRNVLSDAPGASSWFMKHGEKWKSIKPCSKWMLTQVHTNFLWQIGSCVCVFESFQIFWSDIKISAKQYILKIHTDWQTVRKVFWNITFDSKGIL